MLATTAAKVSFSFLMAGLLLVSSAVASARTIVERLDWAVMFDDHGTTGTMVVVDERDPANNEVLVCNPPRAEQRFSPASTFKIPHALFALEAGVARDEFQVFLWDGEKRWLEAWNQDQNLRSSMRMSVVWVYEGFARAIGLEREQEYLRRLAYGNEETSGGLTTFWLDGSLQISAHEQVEFLRGLYRNELSFGREHQRLVKDLIVAEAGRDWILRAKTGWEGRFGWWVGWVERPEGAVFFAINIDTPNRMEDLPKREAVARAVLESLGALPRRTAP